MHEGLALGSFQAKRSIFEFPGLTIGMRNVKAEKTASKKDAETFLGLPFWTLCGEALALKALSSTLSAPTANLKGSLAWIDRWTIVRS